MRLEAASICEVQSTAAQSGVAGAQQQVWGCSLLHDELRNEQRRSFNPPWPGSSGGNCQHSVEL